MIYLGTLCNFRAYLSDWFYMFAMKEVRTFNKWDISGEFSNTVGHSYSRWWDRSSHFSSSLIISGVTVNVKLSISIHRDFYESCYKELLRRWVTPRWNLTLKMRPFLTWIFAFQCHFPTLLQAYVANGILISISHQYVMFTGVFIFDQVKLSFH